MGLMEGFNDVHDGQREEGMRVIWEIPKRHRIRRRWVEVGDKGVFWTGRNQGIGLPELYGVRRA